MADHILIEAATLADCRAVAQLHVDAWRVAYRDLVSAEYLDGLSVERREAMWRDTVTHGPARLLVAKHLSSLLGWVSYGPCRDADATLADGEIWALYVAPAAWSRGVGRALLQEALKRMADAGCVKASLWVMSGNARAIRFYRSAGFRDEAGSEKEFMLGAQMLKEIRLAVELSGGVRDGQ